MMTESFAVWGERLGRNGRNALRTMEITDRLVRQAKRPGFHEDAWNELAAMIAVEDFRRIAANRDSRDWNEDVRLLHKFAQVADFHHEIRRMAEVGNTVFIDVIETITMKDDRFSVNTLGVLEFNDVGKIRRNITFQQWDPQQAPRHVGRES